MSKLQDEGFMPELLASATLYTGPVVSLSRESFAFAGQIVVRDVVRHPGAVGVVALREGARGTEILLVRQYRHPAAAYLWEIPAGLRDVADESGEECARRELREETAHDAREMELLLKCLPSPGGCDEEIVVFVTRDPIHLSHVERTDEPEEQDMCARWWPLNEAVLAAQNGQIRNLAAVAGIFAAALKVHGTELKVPMQI